MKFDHTAFIVKDIAKSLEWYKKNFDAKVIYESEDWAFMEIKDAKLALSTGKHPYHIAFRIKESELDAQRGKKAYLHRDGTKSVYYEDLDGNAVELIVYPENSENL